MNQYQLDEDSDVSQSCQSDEESEDDHSLELRIASQNQYYGRWAAEKWLLRVYDEAMRRSFEQEKSAPRRRTLTPGELLARREAATPEPRQNQRS
jgi:hypothetical protein